jgi:hypothetical protein
LVVIACAGQLLAERASSPNLVLFLGKARLRASVPPQGGEPSVGEPFEHLVSRLADAAPGCAG